MPFIIAAICVMVIAYRYYSAFIAAKVLSLDDRNLTPAHRLADGQNYYPTHRFVLFGHHFAAITGAGPLIGPVLAAQFGFLPGYLWLLIGVVLAGAVHDFVILSASIRHDGKSIAQIALKEMGPLAGKIVAFAILFIVVIALAGLGLAVVNALENSPWGTFTLASTVPVALLMGLYSGKWNPGHYKLSTAFGVICLICAVIFGRDVAASTWAPYFTLSRHALIIALAGYGFIASVLPVWLLLCPRDYLSSFMKLGIIAALTVAILVVNPELHMPMLTSFVQGGGPIIPGKVFPFVFITIACGAISGFHSLVSSGTTPKMIDKECQARAIGYGGMLCEAWVGLIALIAAAALFPADYFAINVPIEKFGQLGMNVVSLPELSSAVGESVAGRPGGAVSLAVGMAQVFSSLPGLRSMMSYWYHFAILFEAMFILTTIDTGTRIARFLVQDSLGKVKTSWGRHDSVASSVLATLLVVCSWGLFIWTGSISTIWPLFGIANQLLACIALMLGTVWILRLQSEKRGQGKSSYALVTFFPLVFVAVTTITAGIQSVTDNFLPMVHHGQILMGYLNSTVVILLLLAVFCILGIGMKKSIHLFSQD